VPDAVERGHLANAFGKIFLKNLCGQRFDQVHDAGAVIGRQFRENNDRDAIGAWENL
jgi:hypothetical protein